MLKKYLLLVILISLLFIICSSAGGQGNFLELYEKAQRYYENGEYVKTIEVLNSLDLYKSPLPQGVTEEQFYKAIRLLGDSHINLGKLQEGMIAYRTIDGMSDSTEAYPFYMLGIFEILCGRNKEAYDFLNKLPIRRYERRKEQLPNYYLIANFILAFNGGKSTEEISTAIQKISNLPVYQNYSTELGKSLIQYFNGNIDERQLLKVAPESETNSIKYLIGLRQEKLNKSFQSAQRYYSEAHNNANDLYHWLAGKQLGLNYLLNIPLVIKDGKVQQHEKNLKFEVSSSLYDEKQKYPIANIYDNNLSTAWVKGKPGDGIGEWIKIGFEPDFKLSQINIINGYAKSKEIYTANNRVKKVTISFPDGKSEEFILRDNVLDFQVLKMSKPVTTNSVKIIIEEIYKGTKYNDTCISEIKFL